MTTFTHSSGQHLSVDDAEIYFEIIGNPIGSPLLLLHGVMVGIHDTDVGGMWYAVFYQAGRVFCY